VKNFGFQWHITDFCNLRCKHCYQDRFDKEKDITLDKIKEIVDKISLSLYDKKISVNITGGEPLLREDIFEILNYINEKENFKEINIITNGTIINDEIIKNLNSIKKFKYLKVSLESHIIEKNDFIRGKGNFQEVINNIKCFREKSNKKILIMMTLSSLNYKDIVGFLEFSKNLNVDGVILERFVPLGRGKKIFDLYLKKEDWKEVLKEIIYFLDLNISPIELFPYKAFWVDLKNNKLKGALCNLGEESMALMPDGTIFPCRRTPIPYGNILKDDLKEILKKLEELKNGIKEKLKGKCKNCEIKNCFGCRALTYAVTGDLYEEDPQCFL
jgi:radical SAM protein with 4Fe4S-binding SPASM domain